MLLNRDRLLHYFETSFGPFQYNADASDERLAREVENNLDKHYLPCVILPVIHVRDLKQTIRNVEKVERAGLKGCFLINQREHGSAYHGLISAVSTRSGTQSMNQFYGSAAGGQMDGKGTQLLNATSSAASTLSSNIHRPAESPRPMVLKASQDRATARESQAIKTPRYTGYDFREMLPIVIAVRKRFPKLFIGVNFLGVNGDKAFPVLARLAQGDFSDLLPRVRAATLEKSLSKASLIGNRPNTASDRLSKGTTAELFPRQLRAAVDHRAPSPQVLKAKRQNFMNSKSTTTEVAVGHGAARPGDEGVGPLQASVEKAPLKSAFPARSTSTLSTPVSSARRVEIIEVEKMMESSHNLPPPAGSRSVENSSTDATEEILLLSEDGREHDLKMESKNSASATSTTSKSNIVVDLLQQEQADLSKGDSHDGETTPTPVRESKRVQTKSKTDDEVVTFFVASSAHDSTVTEEETALGHQQPPERLGSATRRTSTVQERNYTPRTEARADGNVGETAGATASGGSVSLQQERDEIGADFLEEDLLDGPIVIDGYWADTGMIDEDREEQVQADRIREVQRQVSPYWNGLYFGGVCFKKQREVLPEKWEIAAARACEISVLSKRHMAKLEKQRQERERQKTAIRADEGGTMFRNERGFPASGGGAGEDNDNIKPAKGGGPALSAALVPDRSEMIKQIDLTPHGLQPTGLSGQLMHFRHGYMDVVMTSGTATGIAAERAKILSMRTGVGPEKPLGLASGVTPDNLAEYLSLGVDVVLVATGVSDDFHELSEDKLQRLIAAAVDFDRSSCKTAASSTATPRGADYMTSNSRGRGPEELHYFQDVGASAEEMSREKFSSAARRSSSPSFHQHPPQLCEDQHELFWSRMDKEALRHGLPTHTAVETANSRKFPFSKVPRSLKRRKQFLMLQSENVKDNFAGEKKDFNYAWLDPSSCCVSNMNHCVQEWAVPFCLGRNTKPIHLVAGPDAAGFYYAGALASYLNCGFLSLRKENKLGCATVKAEYWNYTGKRNVLECRRNFDLAGLNVLLVDQWIETGGTVDASVRLLQNELRCNVLGICVVGCESSGFNREDKDGEGGEKGERGEVEMNATNIADTINARSTSIEVPNGVVVGPRMGAEMKSLPIVQNIPACFRSFLNTRDLVGLKRALRS
ncbi:unnamed protein product [Amoebophrya sp. A120]|nr:unnamed protein product [Amoebophrya sp. A120]|eukprot:GSA120T00003887001.1